ncbi:3'(2'),5'-bisphosphate nucleotidase 1 [Tribolium castaneum]|nr:PREDICTED: 3'(2'),5'-bisphosphate nucleotidase 1 isoform X1 [Tribolium castaneum]|eukprot:XP_975068.2 PREDICTED: 3'(2'),5'-bisphosphate nucleotidase 1 isoform X1 [Tribolium castaneum]
MQKFTERNTMAQSAPLILRLLASSVTAANRAGKIIRDIMARGDLGIVDKGINDLQTEADRSAQRCIVASLSQQYPDLTIIGEEGANNSEVPSDWIVTDYDKVVISKQCPPEYSTVTSEDIVVWVDPLDGTSEYTQGLLEHVTVLVGLSVKGKAIAGVIHQPYYNYKSGNSIGRTIWGLVGMGVGGFDPQGAPPGKLILTTTRSHSDGTVQKALEALNPDEIIKVGGAGHKVLLLIEGKAHAYVFASKGCKKWDTCAPEAVLVATGGKLTDMHGNAYNYGKDVQHPNTGGVFATVSGLDHEGLLAKIPQEVKDKLK